MPPRCRRQVRRCGVVVLYRQGRRRLQGTYPAQVIGTSHAQRPTIEATRSGSGSGPYRWEPAHPTRAASAACPLGRQVLGRLNELNGAIGLADCCGDNRVTCSKFLTNGNNHACSAQAASLEASNAIAAAVRKGRP